MTASEMTDGDLLDAFSAGDDEAFAEELLEEQSVAVVPGSVFGESGEGHLRVSYATGMRELKIAMSRLEEFCRSR